MKNSIRHVLQLLAATSVLSAYGCTPTLTAAGQRVQIMKSDPPATCKEVGPIQETGPLEYAKTWARNEAAEKGGNFVRWETVTSDGRTITGTVGTSTVGGIVSKLTSEGAPKPKGVDHALHPITPQISA